jgi:branched-chain amino acid transport system permease protein
MPSLDDLKPFIVLGLALGGVFAMSGVGLVVLYRATGVLNLAYGAIGATGALISWSLLGGVNRWIAYAACIAFGGAVTLLYGVVLGPPFAARDPLIKATASIGLLLILLGTMQWVWPASTARSYILPTRLWHYKVAGVNVSWTQILGMLFPIVITVVTAIYLRVTKVGTAMRALANDREVTAVLGVPVRRVEAAADLAGPADVEHQLLLVVLEAGLVGLDALHVGEAVGVEVLEPRRERLLDLALGDAFEDGNVGVDMDFVPHGVNLSWGWIILPPKRARRPHASQGERH